MPFLERARRTPADPALGPFSLTIAAGQALRSGRRHWPAVWLAVHLLGLASGAWWGGRSRPVGASSASALVRASALAPLAAGLTHPAFGLTAWSFTGAAAFLAGQAWRVERDGRFSATAPAPWAPAQAVSHRGVAVLRITGWDTPTARGDWRVPARLLAWTAVAPHGPVARGDGVLLSGSGPVPTPGGLVTGVVELKVPSAAAAPGAFDYRAYLAGRGLTWQAEASALAPVAPDRLARAVDRAGARPTRRGLLARLANLLPPREADLAAAVLLGARTPASRRIADPFAGLGLAHLFAVSGLHVGILLGMVLLPGRLSAAGPRAAVLPVLLFVPLYALLTGLPGSVVRAGGMGLLAACARPAGRRPDALRLLGLLFWAGAIWDPVRVQDVGTQLSYLAAGGIILVGRLTREATGRLPALIRWPATGLLVSAAAQWFTLPLVAGAFGQLSPWSLPANLVVVPIFGLAVWAIVSGLVIGSVVPALGAASGALGWLLLRALAGLVTAAGRSPATAPWGLPPPGPVPVAVWLSATLVLLAWRPAGLAGRRVRVGLVCMVPVLVLALFGPAGQRFVRGDRVETWQFDVGQGDCSLIRFPDGWTALIDTGGRFGHRAPPTAGPLHRVVLPFLARQGIDRLDAVLLTHGHLDHTGGAAALAEAVDVRSWLVAGRAATAVSDTTRLGRPHAGEVLHQWEDWTLSVAYPPPDPPPVADENDRSLVALLRRSDSLEMVWSGDLEIQGERILLAGPHLDGPVQVWKAGHHGSDTSGSAALLERLRPRLVLVSCGVGNRYGHPSHGPYRWGNGSPDTIRRTDLEGTLTLAWDRAGHLHWRTRTGSGESGPSP